MADMQVLIVGAGPTGLALALWLARQGVALRVIDKAPAAGTASRAAVVHARILEFCAQLGIADRIITAGIPLDRLRFRTNSGHQVDAPFGNFGQGLSPYPFVLSLPQDQHEHLLVAELARLGVMVERNTELLSLMQDDSGVTATLNTPHGLETVGASYVCGCDGAHSKTRQLLGSAFPGGTYNDVFYVADAVASSDLPPAALGVAMTAQAFCLAFPLRSTGTLRLIGIVPPDMRAEPIDFTQLLPEIQKISGISVDKVNWSSTYHVHHRVVDRFSVGRVFLAGDAAHIHSPAGGQGMNTGIGDAINLAWKLVGVLRGHTNAAVLDTYHTERRAFATRLVATTDRAFQALVSRHWLGVMWRLHILPRLLRVLLGWRMMQHLMFRTISQVMINYRHSPLSQGAAGRVRAGDRLPWANNFTPLDSMGWQIHVYGQVSVALTAVLARLNLPVHPFDYTPAAKQAGLIRDAIYLVRPDGHVGFAAPNQDSPALTALESYTKQWFK